ncbi:hypothetical protein [Alkalicoccus chagannorensis]|uniref:hypothetical protein n=1 Tax=Alkalicoccus chagannorensis TaxID=427072 RepID=UPI000405BD72|nr:hypothetical protein [Alkalicoccus chagannorensis]
MTLFLRIILSAGAAGAVLVFLSSIFVNSPEVSAVRAGIGLAGGIGAGALFYLLIQLITYDARRSGEADSPAADRRQESETDEEGALEQSSTPVDDFIEEQGGN